MATPPSVHFWTQNDQFSQYNQSETWIVLQLWCWLPTEVHITFPHAHPPENQITQKQALLSCPSIPVGMSTWIVYHGDSLILSNNYASISSAVSSVCLVMVLARREQPVPPFELKPLPKFLTNVFSGINSSPRVKGFLASALQSATKNDALSVDIFNEVVAFKNCFCSSCSRFSFETPEACLLILGAWSPCGKVLKVSWLIDS